MSSLVKGHPSPYGKSTSQLIRSTKVPTATSRPLQSVHMSTLAPMPYSAPSASSRTTARFFPTRWCLPIWWSRSAASLAANPAESSERWARDGVLEVGLLARAGLREVNFVIWSGASDEETDDYILDKNKLRNKNQVPSIWQVRFLRNGLNAQRSNPKYWHPRRNASICAKKSCLPYGSNLSPKSNAIPITNDR